MNAQDEHSRSVWMDVEVAPDARPLAEDARADVAIVGSGIAGLSIGYELLQRGLSVVILDRGAIAGGMTARTTAHLVPICDDSLASLVSVREIDEARGFQASQSAAVDRIEQIVDRHGIACDFRRLDGMLFLDPGSEKSVLDDEVEAAGKLGIAVFRQTGLPLRTLAETPCLRYPSQATFHPLRHLRGLCEVIAAKGAALHPHSAVEELTETADGVRLTIAGGHEILAGHAVVATNAPVHARFAYHTREAPYRSYAMAFEIGRGRIADALYWDTAEPYHYVRLTAGADGKELLIVGGEDHKTGEADDAPRRFAALESWIRTLVPELGPETHRWSGQVMETLDYGAYIGLDPDNRRTYVVTGDSGQGMTHGVVASLIIPAMIAGEGSEYAAVYLPARKSARAAGTFLSENATAVTNMAEYAKPGEIASVDELGPGEGGILRDGPNKIAAYRATDGTVQMRSAVCTHLGCHLKWNSFERCWDCPCHGSHFAPDGSVLNGPALSPLGPVEEAA